MYSDSTLSVKDATGRHISLLNDLQHHQVDNPAPSTSNMKAVNSKRKYHCSEPGCNKSFTTSGHLARHHRIHTGEKNFHCLHPGCPSRFSRQDNMMQHYRTHLSPKSRRQPQQQQRSKTANNKDQPRLHCHTLVGSEEHSAMHPLVDPSGMGMLLTATSNKSNNNKYATATRSRRATTMPSSFEPYALASPGNSLGKNGQRQQSSMSSLSSVSALPSPSVIRPSPQLFTTASALIQPLSTLIKPVPMEPDSATSPTSTIMSSPPLNSSSTSTSPDVYHHHHSHNHNQQQHQHQLHYHPYQSYQISRRPQRTHSASSTCSTNSSSFLSPRPPSLSPPPLMDQTDIIYPKHFIQLPLPPSHHSLHHHCPRSPSRKVSHGHLQHERHALLNSVNAVSIFG